MRGRDSGFDRRGYHVWLPQHLFVCKPDDSNAPSLEVTCPLVVIGPPRRVVVDAPIDLEGEARLATVEVEDVWTDRVLAPKPVTAEAPPSEHRPKTTLGWSLNAAETTAEVFVRETHFSTYAAAPHRALTQGEGTP